MNWHEEHEPFPAFLETLSGLELATMQHAARQVGDTATVTAVLAELKRRVESRSQRPAADEETPTK